MKIQAFFLKILLVLPLILFINSTLLSQVKINEIVSSNSTILDRDGDTPDWIELKNLGNETIDISNYYLSDDSSNPMKWQIGPAEIPAKDFVIFWASGKDISKTGTPRTLINLYSEFQYILPTQPVQETWTSINFDDTNWNTGSSGFGYGDNDDNTTLPFGTQSIFLRKSFEIEDISIITDLFLDIDYDDGFVAYLNGIEVSRSNINGSPPSFNASTITDHEAVLYEGFRPEQFPIENVLVEGTNVLSIQAHNVSGASSDMTIIPSLTAIYTEETEEGEIPPPLLAYKNQAAHTNFKISTEGETIYLHNADGFLVDSLESGYQINGTSKGLEINGSEHVYFDEVTFSAENALTTFEGIVRSTVEYSYPGGPTAIGTNLELSGKEENETIRYTTDLSLPNSSSTSYTSAFTINNTTTIRAKIFRQNFIPSLTQSKTFLVGELADLPIMNIITEPKNFFDLDEGIYVLGDSYSPAFPFFGANFWEDWERPIEFSLYDENGDFEYGASAGVKIFGGWSRGNPQRSFSIFARSQYGVKEFNHPLFKQTDLNSYQAFVLRNSGNDFNISHLRDRVLTSLMEGTGVDFQYARPMVTYINGEYWGIYNMREKINEHFIANKYDIDPIHINLLEFEGNAIHGQAMDYQLLINFVENNDLNIASNFSFVKEQVDLRNFASYFAAQIYFDNTDWPGNNIKFYQPTGGKWKWLLYDTDFGFGTWNANNYSNNTIQFATDPNGPNWPNPPWSTLLFRKLLDNIEFRNLFINQYADFINSRFLSEEVTKVIEIAADEIAGDMIDHKLLWGGSYQDWTNVITNMESFANLRPEFAKNHIKQSFSLPDYHTVSIQNNTPARGFVQLNSLEIKDGIWEGDYFEEVPISMTAIAKEGYVFSHWEGASSSTDSQISHDLKNDETFIPVFIESTAIPLPIVINEINYKSSADWQSGDWIELYNPNPYQLNVGNWTFKDASTDNSYIFPIGTSIPPLKYLIVLREIGDFKMLHPDVQNVIGPFNFGLGEEDQVKIFNEFNQLQDSVQYSYNSPWPEAPNGTGATLELIDPAFNNELAESWKANSENGSPGMDNVIVGIEQTKFTKEIEIRIKPNPSIDEIVVTTSDDLKNAVYKIYDANGILLLEGTHFNHSTRIDLNNFQSGFYFIKIQDEKKIGVKRIVKI